jgi:hypothetical protein
MAVRPPRGTKMFRGASIVRSGPSLLARDVSRSRAMEALKPGRDGAVVYHPSGQSLVSRVVPLGRG